MCLNNRSLFSHSSRGLKSESNVCLQADSSCGPQGRWVHFPPWLVDSCLLTVSSPRLFSVHVRGQHFSSKNLRHVTFGLNIMTFNHIFAALSWSHVCLFVTPWTVAHQPPRPSLSPGVCSNSCSSSRWCYLITSFSAALFFCLLSSRASGSFPVNRFFTSGGKNIGIPASASVLPMNI